MLTRHSRGQVIPIWTLGTIAMIGLLAFALQYGAIIQWQIRAQSAADAAAAGALSVQTTRWNQLGSTLYAAAVEEYRIRRLLDGLRSVARRSGGCATSHLNTRGYSDDCQPTWTALRTAYLRSVARYTKLVGLAQTYSSVDWSHTQSDMRAVISALGQNCSPGGSSNGGDCAFAYSVIDASLRTAQLQEVTSDAAGWTIGNGTVANVGADLTPARIEVVTCANVPSPFAALAIGGVKWPQFKAIGRAAATAVMVTQEWMEPGTITNPTTGVAFQPDEHYGPTAAPAAGVHDFYGVQFGGNAYKAWYPKYAAYTGNVNLDEFSYASGWWASVPVKPYSGRLDKQGITCS